jgi:hypothetical protein
MHKYLISSLLFINVCLAFTSYSSFSQISNIKNVNLKLRKNNITAVNLNRRKFFKLSRSLTIPYIFNNYIDVANAANMAKSVNANNEENIEKLREEANRIIEIIEIQKETFNLPTNSKPVEKIPENFRNIKEAKNIREKEEIKNTLNIILDDLKKNGKNNPEKSLKILQSFCSDSNVIKSKNVIKLKELFADGKYGIMLGNFDNYYIENYNKIYDTDVDKTYYEVDVKIDAPYKTMIYNSIQFDDMYYPENSGDPCYIYFRWIFVKTDNKYMIDGCYLLPKK